MNGKIYKVLFLCDGNADRSQMAEGLLRELASNQFDAYSAGIDPKPLHPTAIAVMKEIGIDITNHRSKHINDYMDTQFDYIITLCNKVKSSCLSFPRDGHVLHWACEDPDAIHAAEEQKIALFRQIREELAKQIKTWINQLPAQH